MNKRLTNEEQAGEMITMLWQDPTDRPLAEKIPKAVRYFNKKYRRKATRIAVNARQARLEDAPYRIGGLYVARDGEVPVDCIRVAGPPPVERT